jgi:signal transduction histidine kinase
LSDSADVLWWVFLATFLAVIVLVGGLGIAMVMAQRRLVALHRSYLQRLVKAHEEERSRIAREVHDDAVQRLVVVGRELDMYRDADPAMSDLKRRRLAGIHGEVEDLADALRKLAHRLHPAALEHSGLNLALTQLAEEMARLHQVRVELHLPVGEPQLDPEARLALFRIAQEALSNVVRHAHTDAATVALRHADGQVELIVQDAGAGFNREATRRSGIGLVGIEERAHLAGGRAEIESLPGKGTRVTVRLAADAGSA